MTRVEAAIEELREAMQEELIGKMLGNVKNVGPSKRVSKPSPSLRAAREEIRALPRVAKKPRTAKMRPKDEIDRLSDLALDFIKKNPGSKSKAIADGIGVSVIDARFPLRKLREAAKIKSKGERLETQYFPK